MLRHGRRNRKEENVNGEVAKETERKEAVSFQQEVMGVGFAITRAKVCYRAEEPVERFAELRGGEEAKLFDIVVQYDVAALAGNNTLLGAVRAEPQPFARE